MTPGNGGRTIAILFAALTTLTIDARPGAFAASPVSLDVPGRADATPWIAASELFVAVAWGASANGKTDVFLAVSRDGGATFDAPVQVNRIAGEARLGGELPPRVALVPRSGARAPEIVVLWTARAATTEIKVARSRDGGRTFTSPVVLQSRGAAGDRGWPALALDRQAGVHAIWLDHRGLASNRPAGRHSGHQPGAPHDGVAMAQKSALYYGSTSGEHRIAPGVCYCCKTALAAGPGGALYAAWRHVYPGSLRDIAFTVSRNGGRTFSPPVRVSEDGWAINGCPDDGPAIAVDGRGEIHLAWPTVLAGTEPQGAIFYASSRDGRRFAPRTRVPTLGGPKPTHPQILVDQSGRTFIAWDELVNGRRVAAAREVKRQADGTASFGEAVILSPNGPAMYPVLAATGQRIVAAWSTGGEASRIEVRILPAP